MSPWSGPASARRRDSSWRASPLERARGLEILSPLHLWVDDGDLAWRLACEAIDLRSAAGPRDAEERRAIAAACVQALAIPTRWPGIMRTLPTRDEAAPYLELGMRNLAEGDNEERVGMLMAQGAWSWGFGEAITDPDVLAADRRAAEEAVAIARRMGNSHLLSGALDTLGATGSLLDGYRGVLAPQLERLELIPQLDDVAEITDIYGTSAWGLAHIGEFRRAAEFGQLGHAGGRRDAALELRPRRVPRLQSISGSANGTVSGTRSAGSMPCSPLIGPCATTPFASTAWRRTSARSPGTPMGRIGSSSDSTVRRRHSARSAYPARGVDRRCPGPARLVRRGS